VRLDTGGVLGRLGLARHNPNMRHHEPEPHQGDAGANPRQKRSLFGEIIPQSPTGFPSLRVSISASDDWLAGASPAVAPGMRLWPPM
jgi:hypothetical protein